MNYDLRHGGLAQIDMDVHAAKPTPYVQDEMAFKPHQLFWSLSEIPPIQAPATRRQYVGPLYPDVIHERSMQPTDGSAPGWLSFNVFDRPVHTHEVWNTEPVTPGLMTAPDSPEPTGCRRSPASSSGTAPTTAPAGRRRQ